MACTGSVYVDSQMEGYLEKKVLLGKSKYWCILQGSLLYSENEKNKVTTIVDISEAHQIRKVQSDTTNTHFEIVFSRKKEHYICPTSDECMKWTEALRSAMMYKSSRSSFYKENEETYETIKERDAPERNPLCRSDPPLSNVYSEPQDHVQSAQDDSGTSEGIYSEIEEIRLKSNADADRASCAEVVKKNPTQIAVSQDHPSIHSVSVPSNAISQQGHVDTVQEQVYYDASSEHVNSASERNVISEKTKGQNHKEIAQSLDLNFSRTVSSLKTSSDEEEGEDDKCGSYLFDTLAHALSDCPHIVEDMNHPLSQQDQEPIDTLKSFLSNNREICKVSFVAYSPEEDAMGNFKSYLNTMKATNMRHLFEED